MTTKKRLKQKERLTKHLLQNLDFLVGSVVSYRLKCGKDCQCNEGRRHICFYLSTKKEGKTQNLYLPKEAVPLARQMTHRYKKMKDILGKLSRINYELLKEAHLKRKKS